MTLLKVRLKCKNDIKDANDNRENLLTEKRNLIDNNEEEIWQNRKKELAIKEQNESILDKMVGESKATEKSSAFRCRAATFILANPAALKVEKM